jgi:classical protein kinase C/novel protein kinase C epsilon type
MLPLGRKNAKKCSGEGFVATTGFAMTLNSADRPECGLTCHATCSHLVPDFCGMTMEMANILLKQLRDIKTTQKKPKPAAPATASQIPPPIQYPSSPAPAAQPPPGAFNVPVPADPRYAAPPPQPMSGVNAGQMYPSAATRPAPTSHRPSYEEQLSQQQLHIRPMDGYAPAKQDQHSAQSQPLQPQTASIQVARHAAMQVQTQAPAAQPPARSRKITLDDFDFIAVLGKGNFGKVMLAEEKRSRSLYAVKVLKKEFIIENDEVER